MIDLQQQRINMVESQVRPSDVTDRRIIAAMLEVPREAFVPEGLQALAYMDEAVQVTAPADGAPGRSLLAPRTMLLRNLAAIEQALGQAPDPILRLAALAIELPEDALRLRDRWRLSNAEHLRQLRALDRAADVGPSVAEQAAKEFLYAAGEEGYRDRVLIAWARSGAAAASADWRKRFQLPERWQPPTFPLGGADVLALGVPAGPRVGELLSELEGWWIAGGFAADAAALRAQLQQLAARG